MRNAALSSLSDEALACRARTGSADCFEELVHRYQVPLLRFLQRKSPAGQEADDLLQESFLRAYQSLSRYRENWSFRTWLFTLSYRLSVSAARKKRPVAFDAEGCTVADDRGTDPTQQAEDNDSRRHVWEIARRTLNEEQYTAVWLHYAESMSPQEVSQVMERSWVWVKTSLHRSRRKLAIALAPMQSGASPSLQAIRGEA